MKSVLSKAVFVLSFTVILAGCKKKDEAYVVKYPVITWADPADITEGTALYSAVQLNARANTDGLFIYSPAVRAQLGVGNNQELNVDFYPSGEGYIYKVSKTVHINVLPSGKPTNGLTTAIFKDTKTYGTMTDQDGNVYKTITIGNQTWMAENLRTTKYRDGTAIPNIEYGSWNLIETGAYCSFSNPDNAVAIATYGRLYNWYAATNSHNIAPEGWHIPSNAEWNALINELGGTNAAGSKMKETGTAHWTSLNSDATNESGFTGLPTGLRASDGTLVPFYNFTGACAYYWSSSSPAGAVGSYYRLTSDNTILFTYDNSKTTGFAIRLIKD